MILLHRQVLIKGVSCEGGDAVRIYWIEFEKKTTLNHYEELLFER